MHTMLDILVARGHLDHAFVNSGWGADGNQRFLSSNMAAHKMDADASVTSYYDSKTHPGVADHVRRVMAEDIMRFGYDQEANQLAKQG